jgi:CheY-like chemotaxis protein
MSRAGKTPNRSARILVVEDQSFLREHARAILAGAGYEVAVARDGAEAVAAVRDAGFDLVLMDVDMPGMDGLTAARTIRALEGPRSKVSIVAFSADGLSLGLAGVHDHIDKPIRKAELLLKVGAWLERDRTEPAPACLADASGATAFEEACELMGRPWALRGLTSLKAQIDDAFGRDAGLARNDGKLAGQAHALVSLAAVLGFPTLSERCSTLEEACRSRRDVQPPFDDARAAAVEVRMAALDLISRLQAGDAGDP